MTLPEHEFAEAERKRREDEIWNAAIKEAVQEFLRYGFDDDGSEVKLLRALKRPVS